MSTPERVLQVAALFLALAGCASSTTTATSEPTSSASAQPPEANLTIPSAIQPARSSYLRDQEADGPRPVVGPVQEMGDFTDQTGRLNPEVAQYAIAVSQTRQVPLAHVQSLLRGAHYNPTVARLAAPAKAAAARSWPAYRRRFVEPIRIRAGVQFWKDYRPILDDAARSYGVPQSIIVAIIGVETIYGRQTGDFLVLDTLATLGFRNPDTARPERSRTFRNQLADLIQLDYQKKLNARQAMGSFAGAIGLPQFMPGSLLQFAVDGDGDGVIDLTDSAADSIASVAHFLRSHGWHPGLPVFAPVALPANASRMVDGGLEPDLDWPRLQASGARPVAGDAVDGQWRGYPLGVIDLPDELRHTSEYRTGTPNFFAITKYNRSYFYAASVADLAQALAEQMGYGAPD